MGLYDRDYTQPESRRQNYNLSPIRFNLPRTTPVVKWLLVVNVSIFLLGILSGRVANFLMAWFAVDPGSLRTTLELWRPFTYQFIHDMTSPWHVLLNMVGLCFFGPPLERYLGSRRFVAFYLLCGAVGGLFYMVLTAVRFLGPAPLVGASGSILGVLAACAVLFPQSIIVLFVVPVPIRVGAIVLAVGYFLWIITRTANAGGEAAHLAGMATGAAYVVLQPRWDRFILKTRSGSWEKRIEEGRRLQIEVDRILAKVHRSGLHSLTRAEKNALKRATQEEIRRHQL
ncbi:MAG: rhomboid family intramembrane serine protease [Planctomycetes bacterium]|jgi:membrane associated rhomboid family serine protease|nr:rhomboid family intramembrane serine protease [Planctomycetota bacterium]